MTETSPPEASHTGRVVWIVLVLILVAVAGWYFRPDAPAVKVGRNSGGTTPVVAAIAQKGDVDVTRKALGTVTPLANVTVRTQISGQLQEIAFKEGDIVQQGDFLAQIDPRPYQMALEQATGTLTHDQALLKEAQLNLERYRKLVAQDSISKQTLDTQESLVTQYEGNVQTDQGQIDADKLNLTYCHITAPITGRIGIRQVDAGNYVQVGDTNGLVTITQLQPITVLYTLPEDDVPLIMQRITQDSGLQTTAYDRTQSNKLAVGKLSAVDNQIDISTGTVKLRSQFDNTNYELFPNQFVNIELLVDTLKDAITVPSSAIQRGSQGTYVYIVKDDNTVSVKAVKTGPSQGDNIAVTDGLAVGDKVVIDGSDKLRDGAKITLPDEKTDKTNNDKAGSKTGKDDKPASGTDDHASHHHSKKEAN
jgi:multidrug efflux system membrane fusion protein